MRDSPEYDYLIRRRKDINDTCAYLDSKLKGKFALALAALMLHKYRPNDTDWEELLEGAKRITLKRSMKDLFEKLEG